MHCINIANTHYEDVRSESKIINKQMWNWTNELTEQLTPEQPIEQQ